MNIFLNLIIAFIVMCIIIWVTLYYTIGNRTIVKKFDDPFDPSKESPEVWYERNEFFKCV